VIKAIAWDIDGTLIDSEPVHHRALMAVSALHGLVIEADDARFVGVAMEDVWRVLSPQYPPELRQEAWLAEIVDAYIERARELHSIAGAPEAVLALADAGIVQCAVSNSARRIVEANLRAVGVDGAMAFALAREDVVEGKPDPEPYLLACKRLGLAPGDVLAIEDSSVGVASARAAGMAVWRLGHDFTDFAAIVDMIRDRRLRA
jgi:beta-phosphoglucomutase-like phosphatase (HAD superfamily)